MKYFVFLVGALLSLSAQAQIQLYAPVSPSTAGVTAQDFELANDIYDAQGADDFVVPTGVVWAIDSVVIPGVYYCNGCTPTTISGLNFSIYTDNAGEPGTVVYSETMNGDVDLNGDGDLLAYFPTPIVLTDGHYWLVANARKDFSPGGQWGWNRDTNNTGYPALWRNPNNGFATTCTSWTTLYSCTLLSMADSGLAFSIYGCINPPSLSLNISDTTVCSGTMLNITATTDANPAVYDWNTNDSTQSITVDSSGIYTVTVSQGPGTCDNSATVNVTVVDVQQPSIGGDTICEGDQPALFLTPNPSCAYCRTVWPDGSGGSFYYSDTDGWVVLSFLDTISGCSKSDSGYLKVNIGEATILPASSIDYCPGTKVTLSTVQDLNNPLWLKSNNGNSWNLLSQADTAVASSPGYVAVSGTSEEGCEANDTAFLLERPLPMPVISHVTQGDGTVRLNVGGGDFVTYAWSNGKASSSIVVEENGSYSLTVTNDFGCEAVRYYTVTTVGLDDRHDKSEFEIFPNPAHGYVNVLWSSDLDGSETIWITDVAGNTVKSVRPTSNNQIINLDDLASGSYMIHLESDIKLQHQKFVVIQ